MRFVPLLALASLLAAPLAFARDAVRGEVPAAQAAEFIGRDATVCGTVSGSRFSEFAEGQPTVLYIGGTFPNHVFSVRIWASDRDAIGIDLATLTGRTVCATGRIGRANNLPEIVIRSATRDFAVR